MGVLEVNELSKEVEEIMDTLQGQKNYTHRMSTSKPPNRSFKRIFKYDMLQTRGLGRVKALLFKITAAYNTIRIFHITCDNSINLLYLTEYVRVVGSRKDNKLIG